MSEHDQIGAALARIAAELGPDVLDSPQRLRAALSDVLGPAARAERAAIDALCLAAEDRLGHEVRSARAAGALTAESITALGRRLERRGISSELATSTVRELAAVLPLVPASAPPPVAAAPADERTRLSAVAASSAAVETGAPAAGAAPRSRGSRIAVGAAAVAMVSALASGVTYAASHRQSTASVPLDAPRATTTATTTTRATTTRTAHTTVTRRVTVSDGVTFDEAHFRATDYASTFAPQVGGRRTDGCVYDNPGYTSGNPCYYYFYARDFGDGGLRVRSARLVKGTGSTWVASNQVYFQVARNGPMTVVIDVMVDRAGYRSTGRLTLTIRCNAHFRCGGDFSS